MSFAQATKTASNTSSIGSPVRCNSPVRRAKWLLSCAGLAAPAFGALFGQHFLHLSDARHLTGNFNAHLRDACVVFADEAFYAGDKQHEGQLKRLVTEPTLMIEPKFRNPAPARNCLHVIISS